jgi:AbrB family looped-hinge helix DNA binding protein
MYIQCGLISLTILVTLNHAFEEGIEMSAECKDGSSCEPKAEPMCCCKVESIVSVDERGQMVLPKDLRERANIRAGDKLAIVSWEGNGEVCCLSLVKAEGLAGMVKGLLGPVMREILGE